MRDSLNVFKSLALVKSWRARLSDDAGQAGILMILAMLFMGVPLMLVVFDGGLVVNARRDAQDLVDRAAMAGAMELLLEETDDGTAATAAATEWVLRNGGDFGEDNIAITLVNTCYSANDPVVTGVRVSIVRDAPTFLAGAAGVDLEAGATATACAGVAAEHFGILPLVVSLQGLVGTCFDGSQQPIPGSECQIRVSETHEGLVGELSVEHPDNGAVECTDKGSGANDLHYNLIYGVQAWCGVGDIVHAKPGQNINKTYDGLKGRVVDQDGACDAAYASAGGTQQQQQDAWAALDAYLAGYPGYQHPGLRTHDQRGAIPGVGDGIDDFYEVWQFADPDNPASGLVPRDCPGYDGENNSPRNVVLIVVNDMFQTQNGKTYEVLGFVRLYLEGCSRDKGNSTEFRRDCDWNNLQGGKLTVHGRYVDQVGPSRGALGLSTLMLGDREIFLKQ